MSQEVVKKMEDYLANHRYLSLGTVSPDGKPLVRTVSYASEGMTVYVGTDMKSRKVRDVKENPNVGYTVDEDYEDWNNIQGIQMEAKAKVLTDDEEIKKAGELLFEKFPEAEDIMKEIEPAIIKIEPVNALFFDYTKGFGHEDKVSF